MAKLDGLNAALDSIDTATTGLADALVALLERVTADDISPAELEAAVAKASAMATRISDASAGVAAIEPSPVVLPDPIEDPVVEPPVVEPPVVVPGDGTPIDEPGSPPVGEDDAAVSGLPF